MSLPPGLSRIEDEALQAHFRALGPLSEETWANLTRGGRVQRFAKGDCFSRPGEPASHFGIVLDGFFRHYYTDAEGRESVKAFRGPFELVGPYAELIQKRPSRTFIEALAPSRVLVLEVARFEAAADQSLELQRLARRFVELHFVAKEQREYEFLQLSAEERYRAFCERYPEQLRLVPQHQIASFIGITPVALSRIRARNARRRRGP